MARRLGSGRGLCGERNFGVVFLGGRVGVNRGLLGFLVLVKFEEVRFWIFFSSFLEFVELYCYRFI